MSICFIQPIESNRVQAEVKIADRVREVESRKILAASIRIPHDLVTDCKFY